VGCITAFLGRFGNLFYICVQVDVPTGSSHTAAGDGEPHEKDHIDLQRGKWKLKWKCLI